MQQPSDIFNIMIKCPATGKSVFTGMSTDQQSWAGSVYSGNGFSCPACEQTHFWDKKDAFLQKA